MAKKIFSILLWYKQNIYLLVQNLPRVGYLSEMSCLFYGITMK